MTHFIRHLRPLLIVLLVAAILTPRMPFFAPEDASRDGRVDLQDAILVVRNFGQVLADKAEFRHQVRRMISVLQVTSNLRKVIQSDQDPDFIFNHDSYILTEVCHSECESLFSSAVLSTVDAIFSVFESVPTPPPKVIS